MKNNAPTLYLETLGCQMNKLDAELLTDELLRRGYRTAPAADQADTIVFITCSVRQHAEDKVISKIAQLRPHCDAAHATLAIVGCMAQRLGQQLLDDHPHVSLVAAPGRLHDVADLLDHARQHRQRHLALNDPDHEPHLEAWDAARRRNPHANPTFAYVRAMRGCNNFCSYCIVPYVRGPEQSRPLDHILAESRRLLDAGVREITLVGQAINAYRHCQSGHNGQTHTLADLLYALHDLPGLQRLRFVTNYPADFDPRVLQAMAQLPTVCEYLHICAQSGSDRILKAMKRRYTAGQYLDLLQHARETVPNLTIAGDFIVGFPSETDDDYQATRRLVQTARFKNCFIFKYSPRPGTWAAENLPDDVPEPVKRLRNIDLLNLQNEISAQDNQLLIGQTVEILVEGPSKHPHLNAHPHAATASSASDTKKSPASPLPPDHIQLVGRTRGDQIVVFPGHPSLAGQLVHTTIQKASAVTLFGTTPVPHD